ncbi:hypothetical protein C8A03DRAFT_42624 [Achaetomium macrosporum]|uniref:C2H2-type domain-containing protein n=1 Tax=Achaetomium macrosporum TaxID=79813 RepID=A0AAN7H897_9PEZI|nr:hypothetical protein C8A03DRAFT_42624 [Achaetomium macrosporum]
MSATAPPHPAQVPVDDHLYDPDEVLPRNSPLLEPLRPTLQPELDPAPSSSASPVSRPPSPGNKRRKHRVTKNPVCVALLIEQLDGKRREPAAYVQSALLDPDTEEDTDDSELAREGSVSPDRDVSPSGQRRGGGEDRGRSSNAHGEASGEPKMSSDPPKEGDKGAFDLKSLAAGALAVVTDPHPPPDAGPTPPVADNDVVGGMTQITPAPVAIHSRRTEASKDERSAAAAIPSPYSPHSLYSPRDTGATPLSLKMDMKSPTASIHSNGHGEGLPPIQLNSPRQEANGQTLPSIRSQLGDIEQLGTNLVAGNGLRSSHRDFRRSPPAPIPRLPSLQGHLASPPIPSAESYRDPLSPSKSLAGPLRSPGYYYPQANGLHRPPEFAGSPTEHPGSDTQSSSTTASRRDRVSIEGIIQTVGAYVCKVPGCTAQPFQTQYLLNSHANVHSSARPHYCPVPGCPRGHGGKGFKRKNEMIRHGLVHESPGYVCPFCPEREHKYPRPDNLQRHVRVHHTDKDKDDPLLRDVLAQRPDGPNRRRRRGPG